MSYLFAGALMKTDRFLSLGTIRRAMMGVVVSVTALGVTWIAPIDAGAAPARHRVKKVAKATKAAPSAHKVAHQAARAAVAKSAAAHGRPARGARSHVAAGRAQPAGRAVVAKTSSKGRRVAGDAQKRRVTYVLDGRHRRPVSLVRHSVVFTPRAPSLGEKMGLGNVHDALMLGSNAAYVIDQDTMEPLYDKNSRAVVPIASITKLMTAMVALDARIPLSQPMTVTDADRDFEKGTGSRLSVGSVLSREDMLHIALMASENRAAAALSRYYPGGRPAFIAAMNAKARQLGMAHTHFENSTGLTTQNVSTARDLAKMVNAAYQYPLIRRFSTDTRYTVFTGERTLAYRSSNRLIFNHSPGWDIGLQKTGFINEAGDCVVMQATVRGRPVIMVLLDSAGKLTRFEDADRVRDWLDSGGGQSPHITTSTDANSDGT
jgi:D-alanyl-D-alanine endopeptidase (penicillin-binding protein 7)